MLHHRSNHGHPHFLGYAAVRSGARLQQCLSAGSLRAIRRVRTRRQRRWASPPSPCAAGTCPPGLLDACTSRDVLLLCLTCLPRSWRGLDPTRAGRTQSQLSVSVCGFTKPRLLHEAVCSTRATCNREPGRVERSLNRSQLIARESRTCNRNESSTTSCNTCAARLPCQWWPLACWRRLSRAAQLYFPARTPACASLI